MKVCLFIPLKKELEYARTVLNEHGELSTKSTNIIRYRFDGMLYKDAIDMRVCLIEDMGNWPTAAYVAWALGKENPSLAVLAGIAGSLDPVALPVDGVVVSSTAKAVSPNKIKKRDDQDETFVDLYDASETKIQIDRRDKQFTDSFFRNKRRNYRPVPFKNELEKLVSAVSERAPHSAKAAKYLGVLTSIKIGQIFSSDLVVDCEDAVQYIKDKIASDELDYYRQKDGRRAKGVPKEYDPANWDFGPALAVDMESAGFMHAVQIHDVPVTPLIVRGVSDVCAQKGDDHQASAARNAILSALAIIEEARRLEA